MRVALIGANGQLGADLVPVLGPGVVSLGHQDIEIIEPDSVHSTLDRIVPEFVVNAAAYNLVDRAEDEPAAAYAVNALGPRNLALYCRDRRIPLLHVSTDYVFGLDANRSESFSEEVPPGPVSAYGNSKLAGEYFVRSLCRQHFVVRTCGLYGHKAIPARRNFVEVMLGLGQKQKAVSVVDDQRCTPTSTADLARALNSLVKLGVSYGLYHVTNQGSTTWCEFARRIFEFAGLDVDVRAIRSEEYGAKAKRPGYSVLNNEKFIAATGLVLPDWTVALRAYLESRPG